MSQRNYERQSKLFRIARKRSGLSQKDVARILGLSTAQFVSNIERGLCGYGAEQIGILSKLLGISTKVMINAKAADYKKTMEQIVYST